MQDCLFNETEQTVTVLRADETDNEEGEAAVAAAADKKRGRRKLPAHRLRVRIEHDLPESESVGELLPASHVWAGSG